MKGKKAVSVVLLMSLLIWGCRGNLSGGTDFKPEVSSLYVAEDGTLFSATVEEYEKDYYSREALEAFVTGEISQYNKGLGTADDEEGKTPAPVAVESCSLEDGKASVIYRYADCDIFLDFAREYHDNANLVKALEIDTASDGRTQGWLTEMEFMKIGKKGERSEADRSEIGKLDREIAVMVETDHPVLIQTAGTIRYLTEEVSLEAENLVRVPEGKHSIIFK